MKVSGNFVFPRMLQSVTRLSFSVFKESKNEINFQFLFLGKDVRTRNDKSTTGWAGRGNARRVPQSLAALCPSSWMPERPLERVFTKEAANLTVLSSLYLYGRRKHWVGERSCCDSAENTLWSQFVRPTDRRHTGRWFSQKWVWLLAVGTYFEATRLIMRFRCIIFFST